MRNTFKAKSENGTVYEIVEYGSSLDATHLGGRASISGLSSLVTSTGSPVNDRGDGTFQIVQTGEIVRPID